MSEQRFQFIEVGPQEEAEPLQQAQAGLPRFIPEDQYLSYFDLMALGPTQAVLRTLSRNLVQKYSCVPLVVLFNHLKPRLPQHFRPEFHSAWLADSPFTLWIALVDPFHDHTLRLLHNATGYNLCCIPLSQEAYRRFMAENYPQRSGK